MNTERFSLAELVDYLALPDGPRDRALILRTAEWLEEHRENLEVEGAATAGLAEIVMTLLVQDGVSAVLTGHRPELPGEWTWKVKQRHFPDLYLRLRTEKRDDPLSFCVLDHTPAGRPVLLPTGDHGTAVAAVWIEGRQELRVRGPGGKLHNFAREDMHFLDEGA
jgi:hypothetical protein